MKIYTSQNSILYQK